MKKSTSILIILALVLALIISFLLFFLKINSAKSVSSIDGLTISIKEGTLTNTQATLIITNNTNKEYTFGEAYTLEKKVLGRWEKIPDENDWFNLIAYTVLPNSKIEMECNWGYNYGELKRGTYRIVKIIDDKRIAVEFSL